MTTFTETLVEGITSEVPDLSGISLSDLLDNHLEPGSALAQAVARVVAQGDDDRYKVAGFSNFV